MVQEDRLGAKYIYCPNDGRNLGDHAIDSSTNGTSGMRRHIYQQCRYYPSNMNKNQKNSLWDKKVRKNLVARAFNQSECLEACVGQI